MPRRWTKHRKGIGHQQRAFGESIQRGRSSTRGRRRRGHAGCFDDVATQQHALKVRRGHVVAETCGVDDAQVRHGERLWRQRVAHVGVGELGAEALSSRLNDRRVVKGGGRQFVDREPRRVTRDRGIERRRHEGQVGGGDGALARIAVHVATGLELLEVRNVGEVDLRREVTAERGAEELDLSERSSGQGPVALEGGARPAPEQRMKAAFTHLEDRGEDFMAEATREIAGRFVGVLTRVHLAW